MKADKFTPALYFLFALSGFSGLIYEAIWSHYLRLFLGHAAYSQVLVLAIFMGGMGLGAWLTTKIVPHLKNLLIAYAIVELAIGIAGLFFHSSFVTFLAFSYDTVLPELDTAFAIHSYKWVLSALIILPQSILLGSTFPLMSNGVIRLYPGKSGHTLSILYFSNSIGAAIGVLAGGFILIKHAGLPGTILIAGVINILVALCVYILARERGLSAPLATMKGYRSSWPGLLIMASFITGMASFIYEIAWLRMLSMVLGASTHAFELMLSAFIFGLAMGSLWIRSRIDGIAEPLKAAGIIQVCMGIAALLTLPLYNYTFNLMAFIISALDKTDQAYLLFNISSHLIALLVMLPATVFAGMTLPLFTHILIKQGHGEKGIGQIYASNTFGAIAGVVFIVLIGFPVFSLKGSIFIGSGLDIVLGTVLLYVSFSKAGHSIKKYAPILAPAFIAVLCVSAISLDTRKMTSGVFRHGEYRQDDNDILFYKDGRTASISVTKSRSGTVTLKTNGKPDAGINFGEHQEITADEYTMTLLGILPLAHHPAAKNVAAIGMGSGLTSHAVLASSEIERLDTIEIESAVVDAARYFEPRVERVFSDPRSHIHIEDAKSFFANNASKYDIIISEPSNPWVSGVASLFTGEFYNTVNKYLQPEGLLVQWIHVYELDSVLLLSVLKALATQFRYYSIYAPNHVDLVILASHREIPGGADDFIFKNDEIKTELEKINIHGMADLNIRFLGDNTLFSGYINGSRVINSDYFPILEQQSPRTRFLDRLAVDLYEPRNFYLPVLQVFYPWLDNAIAGPGLNTESLRSGASITRANRVLEYVSGESDAINERAFQFYADYLVNNSVSCMDNSNINLWLESLFTLMTYTLPFLHPSENRVLYSAFVRGCEEPSEIQAEWRNLFLAVGTRDKEKIITVGNRILEKELYSAPAQKEYVQAALFLSFLASGDNENASLRWEEYKSEFLQDGRRPGMPMTILSSALDGSP